MKAYITKDKIVIVKKDGIVRVFTNIEDTRNMPLVLNHLLDNHLDQLCELGWLDNY